MIVASEFLRGADTNRARAAALFVFDCTNGTNSGSVSVPVRGLARARAGFFYSWMVGCVSLHAAIVFFCSSGVIQYGSVIY